MCGDELNFLLEVADSNLDGAADAKAAVAVLCKRLRYEAENPPDPAEATPTILFGSGPSDP